MKNRIRKPPEEYKTWTEVLEEIQRCKKKLLKEKVIYYRCRFYHSGAIPITSIRVSTLLRYVEIERQNCKLQ